MAKEFIGVLALALAGCATAPPAGRAGRTLRVVGEGRATATPDVAVASFGVEALGQTLAGATQEADANMRRILEALSAAGVASRDVQTTRYDVAIERHLDPRGALGPATGYRVSNEVRATLREIAKVGTVLDAVVKAGSNAVSGLSFQRENPAPELARAREAEEMARAAGVRLGRLRELSEGAGGQRPGPMMMKAMAAEAAPVEPGQLEFTVTVEAVYSIH